MNALSLGLLYLYCFIVGSCIGSFCNVLVFRIPRKVSVVKGRSFCPYCTHVLHAKDLVPLFSWVFLKGRCRYCDERISWRYPLVELLGGMLAVVSLLVYGWSVLTVISFSAGCILLTVALIDADTQEIPDVLVIALSVIAVCSAVFTRDIPLLHRIVGIFAVSVPMLLINLIRKTSFGGGDIKLCASGGFLLGWQHMLTGGFLALLAGGAFGVFLLVSKKKERRDHFAFGPFLAAGMYVALLFGDMLIGWYLALFI